MLSVSKLEYRFCKKIGFSFRNNLVIKSSNSIELARVDAFILNVQKHLTGGNY